MEAIYALSKLNYIVKLHCKLFIDYCLTQILNPALGSLINFCVIYDFFRIIYVGVFPTTCDQHFKVNYGNIPPMS